MLWLNGRFAALYCLCYTIELPGFSNKQHVNTMTDILLPHPKPYNISITFAIYDNWRQVIRRRFELRNLPNQTSAIQVKNARQIMNKVAIELNHITCMGIDKGVIKVGQKKIDEVLYPDLYPHEQVQYFQFGINIAFSPVVTYQWRKQHYTKWRISANEFGDGWKQVKITRNKKVSFRLPVQPGFSRSPSLDNEAGFFFSYVGEQKRGRRTAGWNFHYNHRDHLFNQFISRFYDEGHLSFGEKRYWGQAAHPVRITGTFWKPPQLSQAKMPRKSYIASQPFDDTNYVYIIRMGQTNMYKIGKSNNPQERLADLQTASPYKLKLLHVFQADNASAAEETLHKKFHQSKMEGEWFKLSNEERKILLQVINYKNPMFYIDEKGFLVEELFAV
jgi:hypothetical protein